MTAKEIKERIVEIIEKLPPESLEGCSSMLNSLPNRKR
jgi:hypothetical protein